MANSVVCRNRGRWGFKEDKTLDIKMNVNLLGYKPGDTITKGDRFYEDFLVWATKKSTRNGAVICRFCEDLELPAMSEPVAPEEAKPEVKPEASPEDKQALAERMAKMRAARVVKAEKKAGGQG